MSKDRPQLEMELQILSALIARLALFEHACEVHSLVSPSSRCDVARPKGGFQGLSETQQESCLVWLRHRTSMKERASPDGLRRVTMMMRASSASN
jgi:hypothetical protein